MKSFTKNEYNDCKHKTEVLSQPSSLSFELLDSREAADFLRVSVGALRNMTSCGQVPYYKLGRRNRYRKSELEALLLKNKRGIPWE